MVTPVSETGRSPVSLICPRDTSATPGVRIHPVEVRLQPEPIETQYVHTLDTCIAVAVYFLEMPPILAATVIQCNFLTDAASTQHNGQPSSAKSTPILDRQQVYN